MSGMKMYKPTGEETSSISTTELTCSFKSSAHINNSDSLTSELTTNSQNDESKPLDDIKDISLKVENVRLLDRHNSRKPFIGYLYLTSSHLIFKDSEYKKDLWILYSHISSIEKHSLTTCGSPLHIRCKTFLCVTFIIQRDREAHDIYTSLLRLSSPTDVKSLYCFQRKEMAEWMPRSAGWNFYDLQTEYQRMQVPNEEWTQTLMNQNYELCDTYPRYLYVPSSASQSIILSSSKFRSKARLPVLSYLYKNKAAICRCSQPLSGFNARCLEDEQLLNCILRTNPNCKYMYVIDTRPRINAMANRATGKGYENENFYENIRFQFFGIENIHVMRNSLIKLVESCDLKSTSVNNFLCGIDASGWLRHIKAILDTSYFIMEALEAGVSVVVHCSDGWDRTAQVCSLASILLDPYYRTINGFQILIEKDWLAFGHKFSDRYGFVLGDQREIAPIFTQFIEATWQLTSLFPNAFQFNEKYLLMLHDSFTSCQYGTFIGNSEKERNYLRVNSKTFSLWAYIANNMNDYLNPIYKENDVVTLRPDLCSQNFKFWRGLYCRFEGGVHPRENIDDILNAAVDHSASLEDHIAFLRKKISKLKQIIPSDKIGLKLPPLADQVRNIRLNENKNPIVDEFDSEIAREYISSAPFPDDIEAANGHRTLYKLPEVEHIQSQDENTLYEMTTNNELIQLDWKLYRGMTNCVCNLPFEHYVRRYHCWQCGNIYCVRCMCSLRVLLPGHSSKTAAPVCNSCYNRIMQT